MEVDGHTQRHFTAKDRFAVLRKGDAKGARRLLVHSFQMAGRTIALRPFAATFAKARKGLPCACLPVGKGKMPHLETWNYLTDCHFSGELFNHERRLLIFCLTIDTIRFVCARRRCHEILGKENFCKQV